MSAQVALDRTITTFGRCVHLGSGQTWLDYCHKHRLRYTWLLIIYVKIFDASQSVGGQSLIPLRDRWYNDLEEQPLLKKYRWQHKTVTAVANTRKLVQ